MKITKQKPLKRGAGILLPIASLSSPYGIGTFGRAAYAFIDFLKLAGQKYWQVLPLGPTSYGDSPYQSFSAFSGNPYFIDLDMLIEEHLLTTEEVMVRKWGDDQDAVDYEQIFKERFAVLKLAFLRSQHKHRQEYQGFCKENAFWLEEYSLYMAIKAHFEWQEWLEWPDDIRMRKPDAVERYAYEHQEQIDFWKFCQFKFFEQWNRLKAYAASNGIEIIGDIPIYVALDSADVWVHSDLFQLDEYHRPTHVAGVPPDLFSSTGQFWGNPLYHWEQMEQEDFSWWKNRMLLSAKLYDIIRIDHFVGIAHYYSIPAKDTTAENGVWITGPCEKLIAAINSVTGNHRVIAENLGITNSAVERMLNKSGYPGMKLAQFGFDSDNKNQNLPSYYEKNSVVYGGTHDNETLVGFFSHQSRKVLKFAREYLNVRTNKDIPWAIIRACYASTANTVIFQMQDFLGLDNSARMNTPSTFENNWKWRMTETSISPALAQKIKNLTMLYGR